MEPPKVNELQKLKIDAFRDRLKKREIWINGPITNALVETLYTNIIRLQEESAHSPMAIVINSQGGNLFEAIVATDIMGTISCHVKTIALADAISGGFILFMGGKERIAHEHTCLMMHDVSTLIGNKNSEIARQVEYIKSIKTKMANFFAFQTDGRTTPGYWLELFDSGKDKWFPIEEALRLGLVHKVVKRPEMVDPNIRHRPTYTWDVQDVVRSQQ